MSTEFRKPQPRPIVLIVFGLWILWGFGFETVGTRLMTNVEGTIISSQDLPYPLAPARHGTEYTIRTPYSGNVRYIAGATDASLPRNMPVGTYLKKQRWRLSYERNGQEINDFGVPFYLGFLSIAVVCLVWGVKLGREQRSNRPGWR
jgi:hypothetical protein